MESNRKVSKDEGRKLADDYNFGFFETSAKENININDAFDSLTKDMLKLQISNNEIKNKLSIIGKKTDNIKKKCCQ